VLPKLKI